MFRIEFYETADGVSELWDFLDGLQKKSLTSKDARVQHKQIAQYIQLLADHGTRLGENITKHLEDGIWELRPGNNRVLYFSTGTTPSSFCTNSGRRHRKRPGGK